MNFFWFITGDWKQFCECLPGYWYSLVGSCHLLGFSFRGQKLSLGSSRNTKDDFANGIVKDTLAAWKVRYAVGRLKILEFVTLDFGVFVFFSSVFFSHILASSWFFHVLSPVPRMCSMETSLRSTPTVHLWCRVEPWDSVSSSSTVSRSSAWFLVRKDCAFNQMEKKWCNGNFEITLLSCELFVNREVKYLNFFPQ